MSAGSRDQPADPVPAAYLEALSDGQASVGACEDCDSLFFYPRFVCPRCHSPQVTYRAAPRDWTVVARTLVERPQADVFLEYVPILMLSCRYRDVEVIAQAIGWDSGSLPDCGESVDYVLAKIAGYRVPCFAPSGTSDR